MHDVFQELNNYSNITHFFFNQNISFDDNIKEFQIIVCPLAHLDSLMKSQIDFSKIKSVCLDEADSVVDNSKIQFTLIDNILLIFFKKKVFVKFGTN